MKGHVPTRTAVTPKRINSLSLNVSLGRLWTNLKDLGFRGGGGGVLPYIGYIGMCGPKGYGFSAVLVINGVSILADFGHFGDK